MKKIKIIRNIYLALMPYLIFEAIVFMLKKMTLLLPVCIIVLLCTIGVVACVSCNISALAETDVKKSSRMNMIIKACYIPAHLILWLFAGGMINPFLFFASWIPLVISASLLVFSGCCNIGACVNLFRKGKCKISTAVILCLMGFVYGLEIVSGIIQCSHAEKQKNK